MVEQKFKFPPVYQLGYVVNDVEKTAEYYTSKLGIGPFSIMDVPMDGVVFRGKPINTSIRVGFAKSGSMEIELIQPLDDNNPYTEFLAKRGDGIHHLGFQVDDIEAAKAAFDDMGFERIFSQDMGFMEFAYYDTSAVGGIVIEFLQWRNEKSI